jgi:hypothetical protein
MRSWVSRLSAGAALIAILACSGLGLCWRQIARDAHDCCASEGVVATSSSKACGSIVASEAAVKVLPPAVRPTPIAHELLLPFPGAPRAQGLAPIVPPKAAPLVLRI